MSRSPSQKLVAFIAAGLGTGWIPFMPGTWGSLLGLGLTYFIGASVFTGIGLAVFAIGITHFYEKSTEGHDHSSTVIDEVAGMNWSLFLIPLTLPNLVAAFVVFRILDILKPFPISWADEKVPGAFGTVLDDLLAGAAACGIMHLAIYFIGACCEIKSLH